MHPPLFKPHPLCKQEVDDLVKCHADNPFMKFLNACGDTKTALDRCFREEKKLRIKLNKRLDGSVPLAARQAAEGGAGTAGGADAAAAGGDKR